MRFRLSSPVSLSASLESCCIRLAAIRFEGTRGVCGIFRSTSTVPGPSRALFPAKTTSSTLKRNQRECKQASSRAKELGDAGSSCCGRRSEAKKTSILLVLGRFWTVRSAVWTLNTLLNQVKTSCMVIFNREGLLGTKETVEWICKVVRLQGLYTYMSRVENASFARTPVSSAKFLLDVFRK
jgi:hypothetical protein